MDWHEHVDIYCERLDASFWAEPLNAISNLAFIIAALWAAYRARAAGEPNPLVWLLIALTAATGIGSFLFHSIATYWAGLADVIPIWSFVALYILVAAHRLGNARPRRIVIVLIAVIAVITIWIAASEGTESPASTPPAPDPFNGSLQYLPAVIGFAVFAIITQLRRNPLRHLVLAAGLTFLLSLVFRTVDRDMCTLLPMGTHFLWHVLNGLMMALVLDILIRARTLPATHSH